MCSKEGNILNCNRETGGMIKNDLVDLEQSRSTQHGWRGFQQNKAFIFLFMFRLLSFSALDVYFCELIFITYIKESVLF